ncbi:uncharacterized protein LOC143531939 [Bidens hawaiensis]|uniref:uncharacterized protein LOC143531939 n=1 Tax=Bidens hawaiensis TaxID=980011 RepID=UPI0040493D13
MDANVKFSKAKDDVDEDAMEYRKLVGCLRYLLNTRPDLAFSVGMASRYMQTPKKAHLAVFKQILQFIQGTVGWGIRRRSRTGYVLLLGGALVSSKTKKQSMVSRSSAEAEYRAMGSTVSKNSWLKSVKTLFPCSYHTSPKFGRSAGIISENRVQCSFNNQEHEISHPACSMILSRALYSTDVATQEMGPTETAKELHDKMIKSVTEQRTAPPNNLLWSLIEKCQNREDIKLLYNALENLRKFRLSNLRIFENYNDNLCRAVSKACVRAEAIDFGKKTLWKRNVYGLTPSVASANNILLYAKQHNDVNLMVDILKLLKANDVPMQPGTADIVFSICYNTDSWKLLCKYAKRFVKSGVKLRRTSFDTWMTYAAKIGDADSLWKIEKLRSGLMKTHTIGSGFSCAKGLLLERKPKEAAAVIQVVTQTLPESKRPDIMAELEKLVSEWPLEVIKSKKDEDQMALAAILQEDIPAMIDSLSGLAVKDLKMGDLTNMSF